MNTIGQKLSKLLSKNLKCRLKDGISGFRTCWKQYTPLKLRFAGGINKILIFFTKMCSCHCKFWIQKGLQNPKTEKNLTADRYLIPSITWSLLTIIIFSSWSLIMASIQNPISRPATDNCKQNKLESYIWASSWDNLSNAIYMPTTKSQISLHILAVWSAFLFFTP